MHTGQFYVDLYTIESAHLVVKVGNCGQRLAYGHFRAYLLSLVGSQRKVDGTLADAGPNQATDVWAWSWERTWIRRVHGAIMQNTPQWSSVSLLAQTRLSSVMYAICRIMTRTRPDGRPMTAVLSCPSLQGTVLATGQSNVRSTSSLRSQGRGPLTLHTM